MKVDSEKAASEDRSGSHRDTVVKVDRSRSFGTDLRQLKTGFRKRKDLGIDIDIQAL